MPETQCRCFRYFNGEFSLFKVRKQLIFWGDELIALVVFFHFGDGHWRQAEVWTLLLAGGVRWALLTKKRHGGSLSGRGSNTQPPQQRLAFTFLLL